MSDGISLTGMINLTIDGREVSVPKGTTIFDAARLNGIPIPTLCHQQNQAPVGVCRVCVVDIGARTYAAACIRECEPGMTVKTVDPGVVQARTTLVELLMSDHPAPCARQQASGDCELEALASAAGVSEPRFARRLAPRGSDDSSLSIAVDHEACILCDCCIRGCDDVRDNMVIGRSGRGYTTRVGFDLDLPMGSSTCVSCGECMVSCPTGALTNKRVIGSDLQGERVDPDWILQLPVFKGVSGTFLRLNQNSVVKRAFKAGETICREGEFGSTAYYILEGTVDVSINTPMAHVQQKDAAGGWSSRWVSRIRSTLSDRRTHARDEESARRYIPIDAPVDLPYDKPLAQLHAGDLFGEMTCMSFHPRSATVRAHSDVVVLEMLRNVLDILQKNKTFRAELDRKYRARALETHLKSVPEFASLPQEFVEYLRDRVELIRYATGEVIVRQGEVADAFYLVRLGFVKVAQHHLGGDVVLSYLGRGAYFGEIGLLTGSLRTATCTAVDHVDVVKMSTEDFHLMLSRFPQIAAALEGVSRERVEMNRARLSAVEQVPVAEFLNQGLVQAQSLLLLDLEKCTRCDQCVRACADAHDGVTRLVREGLRFDKYLVATSCRSCRDPLCMVGCPVGSIRRRGSMEIIIEDWCVGCGLCVRNCPYGNLNLHPFGDRKKATGCDLCMEHAEPSCVYACPHDAAHRVEPIAFFGGMLGLGQRSTTGSTNATSK